MVCRLIDFALVVLKLLMFKVCGSIDISKVECFNLSGTERVKQNPFKISWACKSITFQAISTKSEYIFCFFTKTLTLSLPVPRWAGDNTDLSLDSSISKTVRVSIAFRELPLRFLKNIQ